MSHLIKGLYSCSYLINSASESFPCDCNRVIEFEDWLLEDEQGITQSYNM